MNLGDQKIMKNHNADKILKREEQASKHINTLHHYDDSTLLDKSGKLIKLFKVAGLDYFSKDNQTLDLFKKRRNSLLKSFSSEFALYFWQIRRKAGIHQNSVYKNRFAREVNKKYQQNFAQKELYKNDLYIALLTKPPQGIVNNGFHFLKQLNYCFDKSAKREFLLKQHRQLCEAANKITSNLDIYQCQLLGPYIKNNLKFSQPLEFISQLINIDNYSVPFKVYDASTALARKNMFFNRKSGTLEIRDGNGNKRFVALLSIKAYQPITYQGMLDDLDMLPIEYVITQSFRFYNKQEAKTKLRDQQKDMLQSKDDSVSQTAEIDEAFDDAASGDAAYGIHQFTLACFANTQDELNKNVGMIIAKFSDIDIVCVRETIASELVFWGQLPGNFGYVVRPAIISTRNMAAFASMHSYPIGKAKDNHWGEAVTLFETIAGTPYYFNFHYKDVGNFLVFGAMGSGKTVLVGFLILQSMKFGGKRIIFDKDRGLEILVRAMGGIYEKIMPGKHTGFNPCHLPDTTINRKFLSDLFQKMLTTDEYRLTASDIEIIEKAIAGLYRLPIKERQLCHIAAFFGFKKSNSIRNRFDQWHSDGTNAWLFDNPNDTLNLQSDILGFDIGRIINDTATKTPAIMYLIYRIEKVLENQRGILFCDEGWLALNDEYFKQLIEDWSRTQRKKDNIFGLATQVANDTVNNTISKSINESSFCKIFFPNPNADRSAYTQALGLSEHEYEIIRTLPDDQHYFLLNLGRSTKKESVVLRANLAGLEEEIAIISARESTLKLMDEVITEVGDDPQYWLPIFRKRLKDLSHAQPH